MRTCAPVTKGRKMGTAAWVADRAVDCLRSQTGFSMIRLGDGEGRLLAWPDRISRQMLDKRLVYWFGHADVTELSILGLQAILLAAIQQANVIGVVRKGRDHWARLPWGYVQQLGRDYAEGLCAANVHRALWDEGLLDHVIAACDRIVVVTCRDVVHLLQERYSRDVLWVAVPAEAQLHGRATDHIKQFSQIERTVANHSGPGVLVLVGAGVLGKAYAVMAAYHGAVALDIGSVFDGWAQVVSRSYLWHTLDAFSL